MKSVPNHGIFIPHSVCCHKKNFKLSYKQFLTLKIKLALTSTFYPYVELSKIEVFMAQPPLLTRHSHWRLYPVRTHTVTA
jgi:hypothetical protein